MLKNKELKKESHEKWILHFYLTYFLRKRTPTIVRTRGPRGPWVAHLRKRSKVTVWPIIENPRGIIWTTLVGELLMMLYIKYKSTGPCSIRQEDFWKIHFKTYLLTPWPTYAPTGTVWTTLIGDHPGIIPVKFGKIPISGSREDDVWSFPYIIQCKIVTPQGGVNFDPRGIIWTTMVEDL